MDNISQVRRSEIMRRVKSKNTGLERSLQVALKSAGLRFQTHSSKLYGRPDIVFSKQKIAVFVDACFWHGCPQHCRIPHSNRPYWKQKIDGNKKRDRLVNRELNNAGWRVRRVWEHSIKKSSTSVVARIKRALAPSLIPTTTARRSSSVMPTSWAAISHTRSSRKP